MTHETEDLDAQKAQYVCCHLGHVFRAVFIASIVTIVINVAHLIITTRHHEWIHTIAPSVSIGCYLFIILGLATWIHYLFWFEFFLNVIALPIKAALAFWLLTNSLDDLETKMDEPSNEENKDIIRTFRACFVLSGVVFEIFVFKLCMMAHHLMKALSMAEGKRHFSIFRFLTGRDVLPPASTKKLESLPGPVEKIKEKLEEVVETLHV